MNDTPTPQDKEYDDLKKRAVAELLANVNEFLQMEAAVIDRAMVDGTDSLTPVERVIYDAWMNGGAE